MTTLGAVVALLSGIVTLILMLIRGNSDPARRAAKTDTQVSEALTEIANEVERKDDDRSKSDIEAALR